jgi:phosphoribosylamine---glycine ligase
VCSAGYPGTCETGLPVEGIAEAEQAAGPGEDVLVFHAGTALDAGGQLVTAGGRVLGVTALAADLRRSRDLATTAASRIRFPGAFFRRDIGLRVLGPAGRRPATAGSGN